MFFFSKRKKKAEDTPVAASLDPVVTEVDTAPEVPETDALADGEEIWEQVLSPDDTDNEMITLEDGRELRASFVREIRALDAPDLRMVLDEQRELFTPEEYAYIQEVFAERLGDVT